MVKSNPKWRRFEELVAQLQRELAPNAVVTHNDKITGHDSGRLRQIDVTVKQKIGQYDMLIAIDCKDFADPIDVNEVEKSIGLIKDIRAHKGVIVAANGFTDTAKRIGENAGLNLYRLVDTEAHDWQTYVSIPFVCDFRRMRFLFVVPGFLASSNLGEIILYDSKHHLLGTMFMLLQSRWNAGELPSEIGEHRDIPISKVRR